MGWEWENLLAYGNSHMWESYGKSSFPHVGILWESYGNSKFRHVGILWEFEIPTCGNPVGNRHSHMWESYGNSHRNPVGMGWEWE